MEYRRNFILVDIPQIVENYQLLKKNIAKRAKLLAVIKANAYGHGLLPVAKALEAKDCDGFCVAILEEALALRENGIQKPIFVLGLIHPRGFYRAIESDCILSVADKSGLLAIIESAKMQEKKAKIQIAVNTGMNRIGLQTREEYLELLEICKKQLKFIEIVCSFSHFAHADEEPSRKAFTSDFSKMQFDRFLSITAQSDLPRSIANSAALLRSKEAHFEYVRAGIVLYGYPPVHSDIPVRPCLSWESEIVSLHAVKKGESIGYGRSYFAKEDMKIAVVAVGYGDGYPRVLSNKASVIIQGEYCNIVGKICMDMLMVDVTTLPSLSVGDRVVLLGQDGEAEISAETLAKLCDSISYEILLHPSQRVPKHYI